MKTVDEVWDENSEYVDSDVDTWNAMSGRTLMAKEGFQRAIAIYKNKADKWDKLRESIGKFYESDDNGEFQEEGDLVEIGEIAAHHLGYL
jgi:hypothetical protein